MDSEKHQEIEELIKKGRSSSDEGPFYHHTFWESYKGSVKGKFGGLIVGLLVGALIGAIAFALIPEATLGGIGAMTLIGGMGVAGAIYGTREFGETGRITGAIAAAGKDAETRMQTFEKGKFEEIKQDISELKAMVGGTPASEAVKATPVQASTANLNSSIDADAEMAEIEKKLDNYRTTHHEKNVPKPAGNSFVFWKVALVGLVAGAAVGALLSTISVAAGLTAASASSGFFGLETLLASPAASALTVGLIGASFGINRDSFRKVFDKTDSLFRGMLDFATIKERQPEKSLNISASVERPKVKTLVYPDAGIDYPTSETHHQDRVMQNARQLLAAMDHTTASRH